jgi:hypothetical protein
MFPMARFELGSSKLGKSTLDVPDSILEARQMIVGENLALLRLPLECLVVVCFLEFQFMNRLDWFLLQNDRRRLCANLIGRYYDKLCLRRKYFGLEIGSPGRKNYKGIIRQLGSSGHITLHAMKILHLCRRERHPFLSSHIGEYYGHLLTVHSVFSGRPWPLAINLPQ